eukprot:scaffold169144_cov41-Cyclotella_meneghiniana.AAC.2
MSAAKARKFGRDRRYNIKAMGLLVPVVVLAIITISSNQVNLNDFMVQLKNAKTIVQNEMIQPDVTAQNSVIEFAITDSSPTSSPSYTPTHSPTSDDNESKTDQTVEVEVADNYYASRDELYSVFNLTIKKGARNYTFHSMMIRLYF